ncbi:hypothetical protein N9845_02610 [Akkermansiaceae bacterium]|nr:hypothetical protein [Akkermansiaceae bacterium]
MKEPPRIEKTTYGKRVIGADGGELLFVEAMSESYHKSEALPTGGYVSRPAMERQVLAEEKVELHFSSAGRRVKKSISKVFSSPEAAKHIWFWSAVSSPEKPEFIRQQCHAGLKRANPRLFSLFRYFAKRDLEEMEEDREPWDSEIHDQILEHAGTKLVEACQRGSLIQIGELVKHLEENYRSTTNEERELLSVIGDLATREWDIPTQKDVRAAWLDLRAGRDDEAFRRTRDAIGFKWLPSATRGKQRF